MKKIILILFIYFINHSVFATETKKAYFAGGCFWCMEESFEKKEGVIEVISGYSGGNTKNPTYESVCYQNTDHAEVLQLDFDDEIINDDIDEHPRIGLKMSDLEKLKTVFQDNGTITPGNSSGINDGAAALLLTSLEEAEKRSIKPLVKIVSWSSIGVDPSVMGLGPIEAVREASKKANWNLDEIDLFEINEAFASQSIAVIRELGIDENKVNVNGGAIALGHPIGASGARILVTLIHEMKRQKKNKGCATLCIGGGMGIALCVERI